MVDPSPQDVCGPVDFLLLEFDPEKMTGGAAAALLDVVDRGIVRIFDLLLIRKDPDGSFAGIDVSDLSADSLGGFVAFAGARSGLIDDDDLAEAAAAMEPSTAALLLVYENTWAVPFVAAALEADAHVVASARIPAEVLMDALEAAEATT